MPEIQIVSKKEFLKKNKEPKQEDVWDEISDLWSDYRRKPFFSVEEFLKGKKGKVVDLGCGSGRNMIANSDIEYYGVDFSESQVNSAREITKKNKIKAELFKMRIDKLDSKIFKDEMFDYGLFIATLHCLQTTEERLSALREFYRVLKKSGEGLISVWNSSDSRFDKVNHKGDIYMSWRKNGKEHMRYYYLFSKEEIINLVEGVGFKIIYFYESKEHDRFSKKNWIIRVKKE